MNIWVKVVVACMVAVTLMSCAGRRAQRAAERERIYQQMNMGPGCTAQAVGACPTCNIQCPRGQAAVCTPGEAAGERCAVPPSCKCGPAS